jgi:hypothetical protein
VVVFKFAVCCFYVMLEVYLEVIRPEEVIF